LRLELASRWPFRLGNYETTPRGLHEQSRTADHPPPLVGREEELAMLTRRWERARQGDGQSGACRRRTRVGQVPLVRKISCSTAGDATHLGRMEFLADCCRTHRCIPWLSGAECASVVPPAGKFWRCSWDFRGDGSGCGERRNRASLICVKSAIGGACFL
jgi:hypothetical protein